jgi:hypothetical protein
LAPRAAAAVAVTRRWSKQATRAAPADRGRALARAFPEHPGVVMTRNTLGTAGLSADHAGATRIAALKTPSSLRGRTYGVAETNMRAWRARGGRARRRKERPGLSPQAHRVWDAGGRRGRSRRGGGHLPRPAAATRQRLSTMPNCSIEWRTLRSAASGPRFAFQGASRSAVSGRSRTSKCPGSLIVSPIGSGSEAAQAQRYCWLWSTTKTRAIPARAWRQAV